MNEIFKLQAELAAAQSSSTIQRLSERNCVELMMKLNELNLLHDVVYTRDGKEYVTRQQVEREVEDETIIHGGRINIFDLQELLNIDLTHIETAVSAVLRFNNSVGDIDGDGLVLVNGELVSVSYVNGIAAEVNELLQGNGQLHIGDMCKRFGLPVDFLQKHLLKRVGTIIHGRSDDTDCNRLYTEAYVRRQAAQILGALSAVTRPTQLVTLRVKYNFQNNVLFSTVHDLVRSGRLAGTLSGSHDQACYIPNLYAETQRRWTESFFVANGYVEYDSLRRLDMGDPKMFMISHFEGVPLSSVFVGHDLINQVTASIEDAIACKSWIDISTVLPSPFSQRDATELLQACPIVSNSSSSGRRRHGVDAGVATMDVRVFADSVVVSEHFVETSKSWFSDLLQSKAITCSKVTAPCANPSSGQSKRDDAGIKEKRGGKGGKKRGGRGNDGYDNGDDDELGSNTKRFSEKKKGGLGKRVDSVDNDTAGHGNVDTFMSIDEISAVILSHLEDEDVTIQSPEICKTFASELAMHLRKPLQTSFETAVRAVFTAGSTVGGVGVSSIQFTKMRERIDGVWATFQLFSRAIEALDEDDATLLAPLTRHLVRSIGAEAAGLVCRLFAQHNCVSVGDESDGKIVFSELPPVSLDVMVSVIEGLPNGAARRTMTSLRNAISGKCFRNFVECFEAAAEAAELRLKTLDRKRERNMVFNHGCALLAELEASNEPALSLHLSVAYIFQHITHHPVHSSGRCVPSLIDFLETRIDAELHMQLITLRNAVISHMNKGKEDTNVDGAISNDISTILTNGVQDIKKRVRELKCGKKVDGSSNDMNT